jgi:hypothetical protein
VFVGFSELFARLAQDAAGEKVESGVLTGFFAQPK